MCIHVILVTYVGTPVWIVSLDLSKVFDRANWNALWLALHDHGISDHLVWILQLIYANQFLGEVRGEHSNSDPFPSTPECDKDVY